MTKDLKGNAKGDGKNSARKEKSPIKNSTGAVFFPTNKKIDKLNRSQLV